MTSITVTPDRSIGGIIDNVARSITLENGKAVLAAANYGGGMIAKTAIQYLPGGKGALARSFLPARFISSSEGVAAGALSDLPYADIQDRGGTILAKDKKLAIPISRVAHTKWPRDWADGSLRCIPGKRSGVSLLIGADEKKLTVHYVLKNSVRLHARNYINHGVVAAMPEIERIFQEAIGQGVDQAMQEPAPVDSSDYPLIYE